MTTPEATPNKSVAGKVSAGLGLSGSTAAGIAFFLTLITVSQAGCISVLGNGTYSGLDLIDRIDVFGPFVPIAFGGTVLISAHSLIAFFRQGSPSRLAVSLSLSMLLAASFTLLLIFGFTSGSRYFYPAYYILVYGTLVAILGVGATLWLLAKPVKSGKFALTSIGSFLLTFSWIVALIIGQDDSNKNHHTLSNGYIIVGFVGVIASLITAQVTLAQKDIHPVSVRFALFSRVIGWFQLIIAGLSLALGLSIWISNH